MSVTSIEGLYVGYFGRAADPVGLNYWLGQEAAGLTDTQIASSFAVQAETMALYPSLATPTLLDASPTAEANFINAIYMNLFGHAADTAGLSYWQGQLTAGVSPGIMISQVISGAQGTDTTAFTSKEGVATTYTTSVLNASPSITYSKADATASKSILATVTSAATASATGASISAAIAGDQTGTTGTTGVTIIIPALAAQTGANATTLISPTQTNLALKTDANNDTIIGRGAGDLNSNVIITGGGGLDTLNASVVNTAGVVAPVLTAIQLVNLDPGGAAATTVFSATGDTGLQVVSEAGGLEGNTTGGNQLTVTGLATSVSAGMSEVAGLTTSDDLLVDFAGVPALGGAITLVLTANTLGGAGTSNFDTDLTTAAGVSSATGNGVATYNIQNTGKSTVVIGGLATNPDTNLSTLNLAGSGTLNLTASANSITTINGSSSSANLNIIYTGASKVAITGGSGANTFTTSADTKSVTLNGGAGNDTLIFNGAVVANNLTGGTLDTIQTAAGLGNVNGTSSTQGGLDTTQAASLIADLDVVTGYVAGSTTIDVHGGAGTKGVVGLTGTQLATVVGSSNLLTATTAAVSAFNTDTTGGTGVTTFQFGADEYVLQITTGGAAFVTGDGLMKLTGVGSATFSNTGISVV